MPTLKTKRELSIEAVTLAQSFNLVRYNHLLYMPADFETWDYTVTPDASRMVWVPLTLQDVEDRCRSQFDTLFDTPRQLDSFYYMTAQAAYQHRVPVSSLLIRTDSGLKVLRQDGSLDVADGAFIPNTLMPMLNEDPDDKRRVFEVIVDWLDSEEEAIAMLRHFATALAPNWSAVKYVMLLGSGRNGKSVMMKMLQAIFGRTNCSNVTRQDISEKSPAVLDLNGKLLNLVFDGQAVYLKDSGMEKSLVAGEEVGIRKLYTSELTPVQTNALFVEGLNKEPKSGDKSSALQARLIRFSFQKTYRLDLDFEQEMLTERMLGALLSLLIDNYVKKSEIAVMLSPTKKAVEMQLDHMLTNSIALQFIDHLESSGTMGADELLGQEMDEIAQQFISWRVKEGDLNPWSVPDVHALFKPVADFERKSKRINGSPRKVWVLRAFTHETIQYLSMLKEDDDATAVVHD